MDASEVAEIPGILLAAIGIVVPLLIITGVLIFIAKSTGGSENEEEINAIAN